MSRLIIVAATLAALLGCGTDAPVTVDTTDQPPCIMLGAGTVRSIRCVDSSRDLNCYGTWCGPVGGDAVSAAPVAGRGPTNTPGRARSFALPTFWRGAAVWAVTCDGSFVVPPHGSGSRGASTGSPPTSLYAFADTIASDDLRDLLTGLGIDRPTGDSR